MLPMHVCLKCIYQRDTCYFWDEWPIIWTTPIIILIS